MDNKTIDVNKPVENPKLVESMQRLLKEPNQQNENDFMEQVVDAIFLSPVKIDNIIENEGNKITLEKDTKIQFIHFTDNDGKAFLPLFTDWNEIGKWSKEEGIQTLMLRMNDYKEMVSNNEIYSGVVINPYSENIMFSSQQLNTLLGHKIKIEKATEVQIGEPAKYPTRLVDALKELFPKMKSIRSAYILYMVRGEERSYLMIVDTDTPDIDFPKIGSLAPQYLDKGELLDMVPLSDDFGRNATRNRNPFYKKKRSLFDR